MSDASDYLKRNMTVEATFKFTAPDFPAKDIKLVTTNSITDVSLKRVQLKAPADPNLCDATQNQDIKPPDKMDVAVMIFKLANIASNAGTQAVYVKPTKFSIANPATNGSQKVDKDNTAAFWSAYVGGPTAGGAAIGLASNANGSFWYSNPNAVDIFVDVLVGFVPTPPPPPQQQQQHPPPPHGGHR
jgi:hypothetical protein